MSDVYNLMARFSTLAHNSYKTAGIKCIASSLEDDFYILVKPTRTDFLCVISDLGVEDDAVFSTDD